MDARQPYASLYNSLDCPRALFGLPDDDLESMQQMLDLALELNCEFANFYSAMAYPGSALYQRALDQEPGVARVLGRLLAARVRYAAAPHRHVREMAAHELPRRHAPARAAR